MTKIAQFLSINSVQIRSWSKICEAFYNPDPIQSQQNSSYSGSSPIQVQSNAHLWLSPSPHIHEKFLKVHLPVLTENAASEKYVKQCKQMPSNFTHFCCHRVVLSTQKIVKLFATFAGDSEKSVITIKWMANSLSPSRVTAPLLEPGNKHAGALACVRTMV